MPFATAYERLLDENGQPLAVRLWDYGDGTYCRVFYLPDSAGGAGGPSVAIADGADVALGATIDAPAAGDSDPATLIALTKRMLHKQQVIIELLEQLVAKP